MSFLGQLAAEFAARRRRVRGAIGDRRASLFEFAILAGLFMGVVSPAFGPKAFAGAFYAPLLPVALVVGYLVIEAARQRVPDPEAVRSAFDRRVLLLVLAVALIGYGTFVWALFAPPPFELVPEEPPPGALDVTIGPG